LERLFRRAELKLAMSEGFHPKPKMSFPSALALGVEGLDEVMELELTESLDDEQLRQRLAAEAPRGLTFLSVETLAPGSKKARIGHVRYRLPIPAERRQQTAERVEQLRAASSWPVARPNRDRPLDIRPFLEELSLADGALEMRLATSQQGGAGPRDVLRALELDDLEAGGACLTRTQVELQ
jgi:radical SAM-linked protein